MKFLDLILHQRAHHPFSDNYEFRFMFYLIAAENTQEKQLVFCRCQIPNLPDKVFIVGDTEFSAHMDTRFLTESETVNIDDIRYQNTMTSIIAFTKDIFSRSPRTSTHRCSATL